MCVWLDVYSWRHVFDRIYAKSTGYEVVEIGSLILWMHAAYLSSRISSVSWAFLRHKIAVSSYSVTFVSVIA